MLNKEINQLKEQIEQHKETIKNEFNIALGNTELDNLFVTDNLEVFIELKKTGYITPWRLEQINKIGYKVKSVSMKNKTVIFEVIMPIKMPLNELADQIMALSIDEKTVLRDNLTKLLNNKEVGI